MTHTIDILEGQVTFVADSASLFHNGLIYTSYFGTNGGENIFYTEVRTKDGEALLDNLREAKKVGEPCYLVFKQNGREFSLPILAARNFKSDEGDRSVIWINYVGELKSKKD